jgi:hypothetical protein
LKRLLRQGVYLVAIAFFGWVWWRLAQVPFHEDEAIYAAWALAIARGDWGVWQVPIDKPPLTLYPLAGMIALGARAEWMVRLPTLLWGFLALWGVGAIAERLGRTGWMARGQVLASPLWWAMWASAFTDMAGVALGIVSVVMWLKGNPQDAGHRAQKAESGKQNPYEDVGGHYCVGAGVLMGLAVLAKPTMVFLLPLVTSLPCPSFHGGEGEKVSRIPGENEKRESEPAPQERVYSPVPLGRGNVETHPLLASQMGASLFLRWRGFVEGFAGVMLIAWAWDVSRNAPSWWRLGAEAYGTLGLGGGTWLAWGWLGLGGVGIPVAYGILFIAYCVLRERRENRSFYVLLSAFGFRLSMEALMVWTILLWIPIHVLLGFQPWERYLLPMVVLVGILLSPKKLLTKKHPEILASQPTGISLKEDNAEKPPSWEGGRGVGRRSPFVRGVAKYLLVFLILLAPSLAAPLKFAPQDGRWNGIREVGAFVETLPPDSKVWYRDIGRPLAWYAAEAKAELHWVGANQEMFPDCGAGQYIAARKGDPIPEGVEMVMEAGRFGVWACRSNNTER